MAPTRHKSGTKASSSASASDSTTRDRKHQKPYQRRKHNEDDSPATTLPGVQKIKAALRQTRRLLAKDNLAADVRTKTERRLKALEADLAQAEQARKERTIAARYHAVKFFERQKITRRMQQVKRQLAEADGASEDSGKLDKETRTKLQTKLDELRVDLNYIIHYPKMKKYVSLFPPELRVESHEHRDPYPHSSSSKKSKNETDAQREEVRAWVRKKMAAGEISAEPENDKQRQRGKKHPHPGPSTGKADAVAVGQPLQNKQEVQLRAIVTTKSVEDDAFFGDDNENEDEDAEDDVEGSEEDDDMGD